MKKLSKNELSLLKTILVETRRIVKSKKELFICVAIEGLGRKYGRKPTKYLITWIRSMLGDWRTLDGWLSVHRGESYVRGDTVMFRIQWINWMIKQLDDELVGRQGFPA